MSKELPVTAQRLRWLLNEVGCSQEDLADSANITQGTVSLILVGKTQNSRHLPKIATALGVNLDWLMGASDDLIWKTDRKGNTFTEDDIARIQSGKMEGDLDIIRPGIAETSGKFKYQSAAFEKFGSDQGESLGLALIPELELGYSMGGGNVIEMFEHTGVAPFKREWLKPMMKGSFDDLFVAKGSGDSMIPTMLDGDIVLIDTAQKQILQQDRIWALSYGDLGMIKRVRKLPDGGYQINSDNPAVTPMSAYDGEMHVIGRVIWVGRRM